MKWKALIALLLLGSAMSPAQTPDAALRRDPFWNKKFIAVNAAWAGSLIYDVEVTHQGLAHHNCVEGGGLSGYYPSRGQLYRDQLALDAAPIALGMLFRWKRLPIAPYVPAAIATTVHIHAGTGWFTHGCY